MSTLLISSLLGPRFRFLLQKVKSQKSKKNDADDGKTLLIATYIQTTTTATRHEDRNIVFHLLIDTKFALLLRLNSWIHRSSSAVSMEIVNYTYTGGGANGEIIPTNATHVSIEGPVTVVPERLLYWCKQIVELVCHEGVERIEKQAFGHCFSLQRVIMPGLKIAEGILDITTGGGAFYGCGVLTHVECPKLERIGSKAFCGCELLCSINLTAVRTVEQYAFNGCKALTHAEFGGNLELVANHAFVHCTSLERITIPLKNDLMEGNHVFYRCENLKHVHLVEEAKRRQCFDALLLEEWRNDMTEVLDSIDHKLSNAPADSHLQGKTSVINEWIENVLRKFRRYKKLHVKSLNEASAALQDADLPEEIVTKSVLQYLELPHVPALEEASRKRRKL